MTSSTLERRVGEGNLEVMYQDPEEEDRKAKKRRLEKERIGADDPFGAPLPTWVKYLWVPP